MTVSCSIPTSSHVIGRNNNSINKPCCKMWCYWDVRSCENKVWSASYYMFMRGSIQLITFLCLAHSGAFAYERHCRKDWLAAVILVEISNFPMEAACGWMRTRNSGTASSVGNKHPLQWSIRRYSGQISQIKATRLAQPNCCFEFTLPWRLMGYWVNAFLPNIDKVHAES